MEETIDLELHTMEFNKEHIKIGVNGFFLTYSGKTYIITTHHNLPIAYIKDNINIKINSMWNETLILEPNDINIHKYKINTQIQNKLPKENDIICMKTQNKRYEMKTIGFDFLPFDNSPISPMIPYIKAHVNIREAKGLSGCPIFTDNKLIGLFSKYNTETNTAYILPIYVIIKTIDKVDNSNIYCCIQSDIKKINNYHVKNNTIYHPTLKIYIPLSSYFLLEGDVDNKFLIQHENKTIETVLYPSNKLLLSNESSIIMEGEKYKINIRLLTLMKKVGIDIVILKSIWMRILTTKETLYITIEDKQIII